MYLFPVMFNKLQNIEVPKEKREIELTQRELCYIPPSLHADSSPSYVTYRPHYMLIAHRVMLHTAIIIC